MIEVCWCTKQHEQSSFSGEPDLAIFTAFVLPKTGCYNRIVMRLLYAMDGSWLSFNIGVREQSTEMSKFS